jgi:hypothetical protein
MLFTRPNMIHAPDWSLCIRMPTSVCLHPYYTSDRRVDVKQLVREVSEKTGPLSPNETTDETARFHRQSRLVHILRLTADGLIPKNQGQAHGALLQFEADCVIWYRWAGYIGFLLTEL